MHLLGTILEGFVVGFIAKLIMPGRDPKGFLITIILGIGGALLAGWLGRALGFYGPGESAGFIASIIGAIILLIPYHIYERSKTRNPNPPG